jgi:hypothetical protein
MVDWFMGYLSERGQPLRPCFPRDIVEQILWGARHAGTEPLINQASIDQACQNYFLRPDSAGPQAAPEPRLAA